MSIRLSPVWYNFDGVWAAIGVRAVIGAVDAPISRSPFTHFDTPEKMQFL